MTIRTLFVGLCLAFGVCCVASAQTNNSYPMLMSLKPVAVQIGQTTEVELSARYNLDGASKVLVVGDGLTAEVVQQEEKKPDEKNSKRPAKAKIKLKFTAAAEATPGVRDFRVWTPQGVSTVGQVVLTRDPIVAEAADNDTAAKAQAITLPAAACGVIEKPEDLDFYKFTAQAGQTLTFHVWSQRLENRLHDMQIRVDPLITIRNSAGSTLATSDNVYAGDPLLAYKFEQAGEYYLEVRDVRYQGNIEWVYCVEIDDYPFVTQAHPLAVVPGVETKLTLVGHNLPADPTLTVTLPADTKPGLKWLSFPVGGKPANSFALFVTPAPVALEAAGENNSLAKAQAVPELSTIAGVIEAPADIDVYSFQAKAGELLSFDVEARRGWSQIDPIMRIFHDNGSVLAEIDDLNFNRINSLDAWLENWAAPADGKYYLEIRDLHLRGGPGFTYAIQMSRSQPYFELVLDTDKTLLAPGTSAPFYVRVLRKCGFAGEVSLAVDGLPPGITATTGRILATGTDGCIILAADATVQPGATNIRVTGSAMHPQKDGSSLAITATAVPLQEVYSPGGGRAHFPVEVHTVSVADPMDIRAVKLSTTEISVKPGESQKIEVEVERAPGFTGNVTLDVLFQHLEQPYGNSLPKGVAMDVGNSKTLLTGAETKGYITLKAAPDAAPVEKQLIPVMAHVSVNFVMKMTYCGAPVWVTVQKKP